MSIKYSSFICKVELHGVALYNENFSFLDGHETNAINFLQKANLRINILCFEDSICICVMCKPDIIAKLNHPEYVKVMAFVIYF